MQQEKKSIEQKRSTADLLTFKSNTEKHIVKIRTFAKSAFKEKICL